MIDRCKIVPITLDCIINITGANCRFEQVNDRGSTAEAVIFDGSSHFEERNDNFFNVKIPPLIFS